MMTYDEAYRYLLSFGHIAKSKRYQKRKRSTKQLKELQNLLDLMGNPEKQIPHYIHVTGTSGKGSVTTLLHEILHQAGKKVGSTVSPHIHELTERWRIGKRQMSKTRFVRIIEELQPIFDQYLSKTNAPLPSFFDLTAIIGLYYFAQEHVDWVILEVGVGGRFDATNIIPKKDVAVITNIGLDHQALLGQTKQEILWNKMGIIKKGCAVFTNEKMNALQEIIQAEAKRKRATYYEPAFQQSTITKKKTRTDIHSDQKTYRLDSFAKHEIENTQLCIAIGEYLALPPKAIQRAIQEVKQPLRLEVIQKNPLIIFDGAHNADKIQSTVDTIRLRYPNKNIHLVLGFVENKHIQKIIKQLLPLAPSSIACTQNTNNLFRKVADPRTIENIIKKQLPQCHTAVFLDPMRAFEWARSQQRRGDLLLVTGSIYLAGEIRGRYLKSK